METLFAGETYLFCWNGNDPTGVSVDADKNLVVVGFTPSDGGNEKMSIQTEMNGCSGMGVNSNLLSEAHVGTSHNWHELQVFLTAMTMERRLVPGEKGGNAKVLGSILTKRSTPACPFWR